VVEAQLLRLLLPMEELQTGAAAVAVPLLRPAVPTREQEAAAFMVAVEVVEAEAVLSPHVLNVQEVREVWCPLQHLVLVDLRVRAREVREVRAAIPALLRGEEVAAAEAQLLLLVLAAPEVLAVFLAAAAVVAAPARRRLVAPEALVVEGNSVFGHSEVREPTWPKFMLQMIFLLGREMWYL
jgi:hypothetical protein